MTFNNKKTPSLIFLVEVIQFCARCVNITIWEFYLLEDLNSTDTLFISALALCEDWAMLKGPSIFN